MSTDQKSAYFNGYDAVELVLESGITIRCRPLSLSQAAHFHRLIENIASGDEKATWELIETFPEAVDAKEEFDEHVHPAEFIPAVAQFFGLEFAQTRNGSGASKETTQTEKAPESKPTRPSTSTK